MFTTFDAILLNFILDCLRRALTNTDIAPFYLTLFLNIPIFSPNSLYLCNFLNWFHMFCKFWPYKCILSYIYSMSVTQYCRDKNAFLNSLSSANCTLLISTLPVWSCSSTLIEYLLFPFSILTTLTKLYQHIKLFWQNFRFDLVRNPCLLLVLRSLQILSSYLHLLWVEIQYLQSVSYVKLKHFIPRLKYLHPRLNCYVTICQKWTCL